MRIIVSLSAAILLITTLAAGAGGRDRPFSTTNLYVSTKLLRGLGDAQGLTDPGGRFSTVQIERFRCSSSGDPTATVDISCNTTEYGQDFAPDNEIAIAVNPANPNHLVAGSNDYYYRFNESTGARQAVVPTGFFTSFDGGSTWVDGQVPMRTGNGAGDPSPAFVSDPRSPAVNQTVVLMAQLENRGGQGGAFVARGDVSVSRSLDGGLTWSEPVTVLKGKGAGIGPANQATFNDKEWITCDNWPDSPWYGRCYVTATVFENGLQGSFARSPIVLSWSDDGGATWSDPVEISGSHPSCTWQETGPANECDEDQFSYAEVAPDGRVHVHFLNFQNEEAWEVPFDFDSQIMVVSSSDGGATFGPPRQVVQLEDGLTDMPFSVIGRQTIWGHQIRWTSAGTITADPTDPNHLTIIFADRGTPNPNATAECIFEAAAPPTYDPCDAGPGADTNVYRSDSFDGGMTWSARTLVDDAGGAHQWFPWADYRPDGTLAIAWDEDLAPSGTEYPPPPANDGFVHVLWTSDGGKEALTPTTGDIDFEQVDVSVTHWSGQYVPEDLWPRVCGPVGYADPPVEDATGKDCNQFHGDYTGLATDSLGRVHVVWTGLNRSAVSPQTDIYTGGPHDGFAQDAMYARR